MILIFCGNVGTGKTTLAKAAAKKLGFAYFDADSLKKSIYSRHINYRAFFEKGLPAPANIRAQLYCAIINLLPSLRKKHTNLVLDETLHTARGRNTLIREVKKYFGTCYIIFVRISPGVAKNRLQGKIRKRHLLKNTYAMHRSISKLTSPMTNANLTITNNGTLGESKKILYQFLTQLSAK